MNTPDKEYLLYCHINKVNGKLYFGITSTSLYMRFRNGRGYQKQVFGRAIKKYGWNNFEHIILIENLSHDVACEGERYLIAKYKTDDYRYGYNITAGGEGHTCSPSEESNIKRSKSESGENHWHYGQKWSEEVLAKMHKPHPTVAGDNNPSKRADVRKILSDKKKEWHKQHPDFKPTLGYKCKDSTKKKISDANSGENNGNYGKHWYNNGINVIFTYECPDGYVLGRLKHG